MWFLYQLYLKWLISPTMLAKTQMTLDNEDESYQMDDR